jgi:hypothetical protein
MLFELLHGDRHGKANRHTHATSVVKKYKRPQEKKRKMKTNEGWD